MKIRRGKISDLNELYKLLNKPKELQSGASGTGYSKPWIIVYIKNKKNYLTLIAEENGEIAGFILAEISKERKSSFLTDLFVKKEYRGTGLAKKLMSDHEKLCKRYGIKEVQCIVQIKNKAMLKFMRKVSWKIGHQFYLCGKNI